MNEWMNVILERSSIRGYQNEALDDASLERLKRAALAAPTAVNRQENRFCFITDRKLIDKINAVCFQVMADEGETEALERMKARGTADLFYGAPLLVVIYSSEFHYALIDAGIAVQTLALAAQSLGLGSCINGMCGRAFRRSRADHLCAELGMAEDENYRIAIAIGKKSVEKLPHEHDFSHIRVI